MRRALLIAVLAFLAAPPAGALAATIHTKMRVYSKLDDRPEGYFLAGDTMHVVAHNFVPKPLCSANAKFTLIDSAGHHFGLGSTHPGYGQYGEGLVRRDIPVPPGVAFGTGRIESEQKCRIRRAAGHHGFVRIDPHGPVPRVTSAAVADVVSGDRTKLSFALNRYAYVRIGLELELVAGDWREIDVPVDRQFVDAGGHTLKWRAALDAKLPPGHYRFRITPRAPTIQDPGPARTQDFYVASAFGQGKLGAPSGALVFGDPLRLGVADGTRNRVQVFRPDGALALTIPSLSRPLDLAFASPFYLVASSGSHRVVRVQVVGPQDGSKQQTIQYSAFAGGPGSGSGQFAGSGPVAVAATPLNGGRMYVVDGRTARVQAFDLSGRLQSVTAAGGLRAPAAIAVAGDGTLWIGDPAAGRVVHTTAGGSRLSQVTIARRPVAVEVDAGGRVLVSDAATARVFVLSPAGTAGAARLAPVSRRGPQPRGLGAGLLARPAGVAAIGVAGDVFVVDATRKRVLRFRAP